MARYITKGKGNDTRHIRIEDGQGSSHIEPSNDHWIQRAINPERKGYAASYVFLLYGDKAFYIDGSIKVDYLEKALEHAKKEGRLTAVRELNLAKKLKSMSRDRSKSDNGHETHKRELTDHEPPQPGNSEIYESIHHGDEQYILGRDHDAQRYWVIRGAPHGRDLRYIFLPGKNKEDAENRFRDIFSHGSPPVLEWKEAHWNVTLVH